MSSNKPLENNDLDALLLMHFLNEYSEEEGLVVAQTVFEKEYAVEIDKKKEQQLLKKLGGQRKGGINWGVVIGVLVVGALIIFGLLLAWPAKKEENKKQDVPITSNDSLSEEEASSIKNQDSLKKTKNALQKAQSQHSNDTVITISPDPVLSSLLEQSLPVDEATGKLPPNPVNASPNQSQPESALFSTEELEHYQQLKKSVIENLIAYHEGLYTEVDGGIVNYKKRRMNVDRFIIRNISVTNMEYKVFLSDLISRRNSQGLEVALVNDEGWIYYQCNQLGESYFKERRYDGFPVVNISADAMALYCKWIEKEVNAYLVETKSKAKPLKIRLPYTYEWIHAAYTGSAYMQECPGYYTIFSLSEGYVNKSFINRIEKLRKKDRRGETLSDTVVNINRYGMQESEMLQIFKPVTPDFSGDREFQEYPAGLINIGRAAHVSELNQDGTGEQTVVVGCWKSKKEYSGMLREFNELSGSPFVGFRFVIDDGRSGNYVQPLW